MLDAIPDGEPVRWLYAPMREYPSRAGKALRPALCLSTGRAFGGDTEDLLGVAVAIEMMHNAFLVHDDVADGSEMRRGRPTLSATHGTAAALNAGDGLAVIAGQVLRRATRRFDDDLSDRVWAEFDMMALRTLEGQATEAGWQLDDVQDLGPSNYLELIMHKTCWYTTIHPLRVGAIVGSKRRCRPGSAGAVRVSLRRSVSNPRRLAESGRHRTDVRQRDPRRYLRGQANPSADAFDVECIRQGHCSGARLSGPDAR